MTTAESASAPEGRGAIHEQGAGPGLDGAGVSEPITPEIVEPSAAPGPDGADVPPLELTVEDLIDQLERVTQERDGHFDARARLQAEFDNYRKRIAQQQVELLERAAEGLVGKLLPVLDACDAAVALSVAGAEPIASALSGVLEKEGLSRIEAIDQPFDPELHEAVIHEPGDESHVGPPKVAEVLRAGYQWKSRVLRPAMVKVRG